MNILTDELPEKLTIQGEICPIRYDFKTWIKFTQICNKEIGAKEMAEIFALVFYKLPKRFDKAIKEIMDFYFSKKAQFFNKSKEESKKIYDFDYDSNLIYSAFLQQYNIDLCVSNLHWWQFKALFDNLSEGTQFVKVLGYRSMDLSKIKDKEQKKFYVEMKNLYRLPDNRTQKQKERALNNALSALF